MTDFLYILASVGFFGLMILSCGPATKSNRAHTMENTIVGIISLALIGYLIFTIIRPEKF